MSAAEMRTDLTIRGRTALDVRSFSRTASSSNDPTNQQSVTLTPHDTVIHSLDYSSRANAAIPLIVTCQCAVARQVVAP